MDRFGGFTVTHQRRLSRVYVPSTPINSGCRCTLAPNIATGVTATRNFMIFDTNLSARIYFNRHVGNIMKRCEAMEFGCCSRSLYFIRRLGLDSGGNA